MFRKPFGLDRKPVHTRSLIAERSGTSAPPTWMEHRKHGIHQRHFASTDPSGTCGPGNPDNVQSRPIKPLRSPVGEPARAYTAGVHAHTGNVREQAFGSLLWYCHTMVAETATPAGLRITTATRLRLHSLRLGASVIPREYRTVRKSKGPVRQYCRTGPKYVEVFCF